MLGLSYRYDNYDDSAYPLLSAGVHSPMLGLTFKLSQKLIGWLPLLALPTSGDIIDDSLRHAPQNSVAKMNPGGC